MPETFTVVPTPTVGLRFTDVAYPQHTWEVVQTSPVIYMRRDDGLVYHHSNGEWRHAWKAGYLAHVDVDASGETR